MGHNRKLGLWALSGAITLLMSCGQAPKNPELEFWTMQLQPKYTDYFKGRIAAFEAQNPGVKVRWVDVPWSGMESKMLTAVAGKTVPDVVNLNPGFASQMAERGAWMNLNDKVPQDVQKQYLPKIWQASVLDGQSFGVPWYLTTRIAIYNSALLKQAGLAKPPANFQELVKAAQVIKEKTGKYAFFSTLVPEDSGEVMELFVQEGVTLVDEKGKATFNTPKGKALFQTWVDLYKKGWIPKEVLTEGHRYGIDLYQRGDSAILQSSPEFFRGIAANAPDVAKVSLPAPQLTGATGKKNVAVMNLVVPKDTDQPEAALKFVLFLANAENQLSFAKAANVLPSIEGALKDPYFSQTGPSPLDQARVISAQQLKDAQVLMPAMKNGKLLQKAIYENLQAAMLDKKTVDQAINDAEKTWNEGAQ